MLLKSWVILLAIFFSFALIDKGESFIIKDFVMDKIVKPISSVFPGKDNTTDEEEFEAKEHGNFDSLGRDIIRGTSKKLNEFTETIKKTFSKVTQGLDCNKTLSEGSVDGFKSRLRAIYPGTKWCGDGNISTSYDDLGKFASVDRCCREHDMCPDAMPADSTKYGLENTGLFTRSHCDCDEKFYECLKEAKNLVGNSIGFTYFTVLGPQCFRKDFPVVDCLDVKKGKCVEYRQDTSEDEVYQWFDSPPF